METSVFWGGLASVLAGLTAATAWQAVSGMLNSVSAGYLKSVKRRTGSVGVDLQDYQPLVHAWWAFTATISVWLAMGPGAVSVAIVLAGIMLFSTGHFLKSVCDGRRAVLRDQMVGVARNMTSQLRAGLDIPASLAAAAEDAPEPLRGELLSVVSEYRDRGISLNQALDKMRDRLQVESVTMFILTLQACMQKGGGRLTEMMEKISLSLEQLQRVEQKQESNTAAGRLLVLTLTLFPFGFGGFFMLIDPDNMMLVLTTARGQLVISAALILTYAATRWSLRIVEMRE